MKFIDTFLEITIACFLMQQMKMIIIHKAIQNHNLPAFLMSYIKLPLFYKNSTLYSTIVRASVKFVTNLNLEIKIIKKIFAKVNNINSINKKKVLI